MALGDRRDGKLLRNVDGMHFICPIIYPNRCDNEAFISERIDLTNIDKYLKKKNTKGIEYKYNFFQLIVTALLKVLYLRPKMNYFIQNSNMYERYEKTASFVVKKKFSDDGSEGLAFITAKPEYTVNDIHDLMYKIIYHERKGGSDASSDMMDIFNKMPRFLSKFLVHIVMFLDKKGICPQFLIESDPYYSSIVLSNLGSIKLHSAYHHLTNWGTNSLFCAVGEIKKRPILDEKGQTKVKNTIDIGLTIDERIADGYYYSKTIKLLKYLLENPSELEKPLSEEVDYDK